MLNVMIIDKEAGGRAAMSQLLHDNFSNINIVGEIESAKKSVELILKNPIDLIFMDENSLDEEKGSSDLINHSYRSAYDLVVVSESEPYNFCSNGQVLEYITKPLDTHKLKTLVNKVSRKKDQIFGSFQKMINEFAVLNCLNKRISLCDKYELIFPKISEIIYCKADGFYTQFFLKDGTTILVSKNIKEYESILPPEHFFRAHKSFLINLNEIKKYIKGEGGYIVMENGDNVPISIRKKEDFLKAVMNSQMNNHHYRRDALQ